MTESMKTSIQEVYKELSSLSKEEFHKRLEKRKNDDFAKILQESGAISVISAEMKELESERSNAEVVQDDRMARNSKDISYVPIGGV